MPVVAVTIALLVLLSGLAELAVAKQNGLPGRRVGGGTRYELLQQSHIQDHHVPSVAKELKSCV